MSTERAGTSSTTFEPIREKDKPKLAGPVMMWRDEDLRHGFEAVCHRCKWTLSDAVRWMMVHLDEQWLREYVVWHLRATHGNQVVSASQISKLRFHISDLRS